MGFTKVLGLTIIPYSISIRYFLNSWPINYFPWSYVISIGLGYLDSHVVSTKLSIDIALLSFYCVNSDHPVTGSIMITDFRFRFYFCLFLCIKWYQIISTNSLFHGIFSDYLTGNLPYFIFDSFLCWQVSQLVTSFRTASLMPG